MINNLLGGIFGKVVECQSKYYRRLLLWWEQPRQEVR